MHKSPLMRRTLTAFSAITLIPLTYTLINRNDSVERVGSKPVDLEDIKPRPRQALVHHCGECSHDHGSVASFDTASHGLIWETSSSSDVSESMSITNGMPLANHYLAGTRQQLVLEDGNEVELHVKSRFVHQDGTVAVAAVIPGKDGQPDGQLHLQWNDADQFFHGEIEYLNHPVAYEIANNDQGETKITRRSIDQMVCSEVDPVTQVVTYGLPAVDLELAAADPHFSSELEAAGGSGEGEITEEAAMLVPSLNSYPAAEAVVYLDFDGQVVSGTSWGSTITAAPTGYSAAKITDIWKRVAADMEPFELNVTTDESVYLNAPSTKRIRCIITPTSEWYTNPSVGGVAKRSSFSWSGDTPCWAFSDNLLNGNKYVAECCSHEVGHTFGLSHDGKTGTTYYAGHGSGSVGWAPIMGNGYYKTLTQWSKGEYSSATNTQDDLSIITSGSNGFGYRSDDHNDRKQGATVVVNNVSNQISEAGVIETRGDVDVFELTSGAGSISVDVTPAGAISNLDIEAELYDSKGNLLVVANPATLLNTSISTTVEAGTFYLHVRATGYGTADTGSTDYASLGAYQVTGQMAVEVVPTPYELTVAELAEQDRDLSDDPDGDGLNNLAEHVLGTNPAVADAVQNFTRIDPSGATGADFLIDLPSEIPADAVYTVEATCDLASDAWDSVASCDGNGTWTGEATVEEESGPDGKRRFRVTDSSGESWTCRFMRVRFELASS